MWASLGMCLRSTWHPGTRRCTSSPGGAVLVAFISQAVVKPIWADPPGLSGLFGGKCPAWTTGGVAVPDVMLGGGDGESEFVAGRCAEVRPFGSRRFDAIPEGEIDGATLAAFARHLAHPAADTSRVSRSACNIRRAGHQGPHRQRHRPTLTCGADRTGSCR